MPTHASKAKRRPRSPDRDLPKLAPAPQRRWIAPLLLTIVTLAALAPVCASEFVMWDDNLNVTKNPSFNPPTLAAIAEFWTRPFLDLYIPVTYCVWGMLAAVAQVSLPDSNGVRLNPYIFHTANLLLHLTAALIVYALLRRLIGKIWPALAGAMLFAIHPLQVEPVAWVTGLKDVLSGMLTLAALWEYVCFADERDNALSSKTRRVHYALALLCFVLAVLSKPSAVIFPLAALVLDRWMLRRPWRKILFAIVPLLLVSIGGMILTRIFQSITKPADGGRILLRPLIATDALAFYLYKLVFPWKLGVHYDRAPLAAIHHGWIYYTWIVPAAVAVTLIVLRKRIGWLAPAALLFVIPLAPVLGLVPFSYQRFATVADRYVYVAMLGPALAIALALARIGRGRIWIVITAVVLALFAGRSVMQTLVWHDNSTLFHRALETNPRSFLAYNHLAGQLLVERHLDEPPEAVLNRIAQAREYSQRAIDLAPDIPDGYLTLGLACDMTNDETGAIAAFRKAVELQPDKADSLHALGGALAKEGKFAEAEPLLRRAIEVNPRFAQAHLNLGLLLSQKFGVRNEEAFRETELAVRLDPSDPRAHVNLATFLAIRGAHDAALSHLKTAIQIDPTLPQAQMLQRQLRAQGH